MKNYIYIAIASIVLMACGSETATTIEEQTEVENTNSIEEIKAPITSTIECFGVVDVPPSSINEIFSKTNGYIVDLAVLEGEHIKEGDLLAAIESPEFALLQKEYKSAKANYDWQKQHYERNQQLYASKSISDKDFQTIIKDFELAKSAYFGLKEQLTAIGFNAEQLLTANSSRLTIRSKTHGTVVKINVKNGTKVSPETHLFTIIDKTHLHVEMSVSASYITQVKKDMPFYFLNGTDSINGTVYLINDLIESDNTVKVHGHFNDVKDEEKLIVGQKIFVNILP
ncbi:MAG: HlyD family efflux transporter periplasmic adaptor subunit [Flavobacteriales bacterium]|nr:MAG: HlyD family efflux transporter periplasmic adaptor subunit [Flavobacteriales bacterium]